ncbi:hypothetical protein KIS1582_4728 [Cytobacillus firmus]|uniref:Uncharacterized protein n=1 Tax=Cytobacillus firmus TaxID=1399 RepID=A0A800N871_CYTFI|nr:hypothetical protein KIS1582_4728 [Cytobacillus firmus]
MWIKPALIVDNVEKSVESIYNCVFLVIISVDNKKDWQ